MTNIPAENTTCLAVFKLDGTLSVGFTGLRNNNITGFDFSNVNQTNLYPKLERENENYLIIGDVDTN